MDRRPRGLASRGKQPAPHSSHVPLSTVPGKGKDRIDLVLIIGPSSRSWAVPRPPRRVSLPTSFPNDAPEAGSHYFQDGSQTDSGEDSGKTAEALVSRGERRDQKQL